MVAVVAAAPAKSGNMNGKYSVASMGKQDVPYNDDYASKGYEYFDVWAPEIASQYGEVFWTDQGNNALPDHIVQRFKGKVMAIMGYEQDQVMVNPPGHPGVNPDQDVSVPINWAYNHHYMAWMTGSYSKMVEINVDPEDTMAHGSATRRIAVDLPEAAFRKNPSIPTAQMFSEGNGGESRKSYHGYPKGFAQLIESPTEWHITPMQIDTRNRECGITPADLHNCTQFTPGVEPKQARYGRGIPAVGTNYSGLLECPCNTRFGGDPVIYPDTKTKQVEHEFSALAAGTCNAGESLVSAPSCFAAAASLGFGDKATVNVTVNNASLPEGCSVTVNAATGVATVSYNTAKTTAGCTTGNRRVGERLTDVGVKFNVSLDLTSATFVRSPKGQYCSLNKQNILQAFQPPNPSDAEAEKALGQCEAFCKTSSQCWGCSVDLIDQSEGLARWLAIPDCGKVLSWAGKIPGDISQKVGDGNATLTLSGPADAWFGVGLDAVQMSDQPYTLIVNSTGVYERKIGTCGSEAEHCPGDALASSLTVLSTQVASNVRTVVVTRPLKGLTKDHYTFAPTLATLNFIAAIGSSQEFAYHKAHATSVVSLTTPGAPTCVCDLGANGKLCETDGSNCETFVKSCVPPPAGSLLSQHNPTCNSRQYAGGLRCCGHKRIMLDADQVSPPDSLLRYHMKFRFWFQEYTPATATANASHSDLPRIYQQTEANAGEYDIPPAFVKDGEPIPGYNNWPANTPTPGTNCSGTCPDGPDCVCEHRITYTWNISNTRLIYAGGHCHAPACISMELYYIDKQGQPQILCRQIPKYGQGNVKDDKYDEAGYIALPPCLWGDDEGLEPSVFLPENTQLLSIKRNRNTDMGHYGEMASWQMRGVNF